MQGGGFCNYTRKKHLSTIRNWYYTVTTHQCRRFKKLFLQHFSLCNFGQRIGTELGHVVPEWAKSAWKQRFWKEDMSSSFVAVSVQSKQTKTVAMLIPIAKYQAKWNKITNQMLLYETSMWLWDFFPSTINELQLHKCHISENISKSKNYLINCWFSLQTMISGFNIFRKFQKHLNEKVAQKSL